MPRRILATAFVMMACAAAAHAQSRHADPERLLPPQTSGPGPVRANQPPAIVYHLHYDGKDWGPYTLEDLKKQAADNAFFIDDLVWKAGATKWLLASDYPELAFAPVYVEPAKPATGGQFYVDAAGQSTGPFSFDDMKAKAAAGEISADSVVWTEGLDGWKRAATVDVLKPLFPAEAEQKPEGTVEAEAANQDDAAPKTGDDAVPEAQGENTAAAEAGVEGQPEGPAEGEAQEAAAAPEAEAKTDGPPAPPDAGPDIAPPPPPDAKISYFVSVGGKATGPFDVEAIKAKIAAGEITRVTYLWWKGADWTQAEKVAAFVAAFDDKPKAPPFDCSGYLVGVWERTQMIGGQPLTVRSQFDANGQYVTVQTLPGYPGTQSYGDWKAEAVGEAACSIQTTTKYPSTQVSTAVYEILDRYVMKDKADGAAVRRLQ